jgi:hypothetical protein
VKFSWAGTICAACYVVIAVVIIGQDFNCGGGLDINICGLGTLLVTFPSYVTVGRLFSSFGLAIKFSHTPDAADILQLAVHILLCAVIVYLIAFGLERMVSYFIKFLRR